MVTANVNLLRRLRQKALSFARRLLWPLTLLAIAAVILELGVWPREETYRGPFPENVPGTQAVYISLAGYFPFHCCLGARSDTNDNPIQSDLRLWVDGREIGPPHSLHADIRSGATTGFSHWNSHWNGYVIFSLPRGVANTPATSVTIRYSVRPWWSVTVFLVSASAFLWLLLYPRPFVRAPYLLVRILVYVGLAASLIYIACSIGAIIAGWALPTTALIRWSPIAVWLAYHEPLFGFYLLAFAAFGTVGTWLAFVIPEGEVLVQREETTLLRFLRMWGVVIGTCVFVFSLSIMWVGIVTPGQLQGSSIGGLIPFNDAGGYAAEAFDQARDGVWSGNSLRRPLAAAFRSALSFLSGSSYSSMLLLQTCLLSGLACFAAWAIIRWRGLWAGVAFFGLTYIYVRTFAPTTLTEPLGLCWALFAIPFLIAAFRTRSLPHALLALGALTVALMTRMGAMLTIPALVIWIFCQFGQTWRQRWTAGIAAMLVVLAVVSVNFALVKSYGSEQGLTGGNFSYVICGLTIGATWDGCPRQLQEAGKEMPKGEAAAAQIMYVMAWQNFKKQPNVLIKRLLRASDSFLSNLPDQLFRGYAKAVVEPSVVMRNFISLVSVVGLIFVFIKGREKGEILFWMLLWLSVIASASIVYFDDGDRVLAVSYVLLSLFFALGFASPKAAAQVGEAHQRILKLFGISSFAIMTLLFLGLPWLAYRLSPVRQLPTGRLSVKAHEDVIYGGRRMTGFLVVPDGTPLRNDIPTLDLATFSNVVKASGIEFYQGLVTPGPPPAPFGFVFASKLNRAQSGYEYIVPTEVMERRAVPAWRIDIEQWQGKPLFGSYWFLVTHAEPLQ